MPEIGTVKSWFDVKGFGFIVQEGVQGDIFVHYTEIKMGGRRCLNPGQLVQFRIERRDRGLCAVDVEVVDGEVGKRCHACGKELKS
jgi:cold shock protein